MTLKITIEHDENGADVWEYEEEVIFLSNHRDYSSCNTDLTINDFESQDEIQEHFGPEFEVHQINAYIHGGIALSLGSSYPFNCQWDSGNFGYVIFKKGTFGQDNCGLSGFVESWGRSWNGEVYYYSITDTKGDILDSCGGFIGYEYCEEEAESQLKYYQAEEKRARTNKIKDLIKNRVPLDKRLYLIPNAA